MEEWEKDVKVFSSDSGRGGAPVLFSPNPVFFSFLFFFLSTFLEHEDGLMLYLLFVDVVC